MSPGPGHDKPHLQDLTFLPEPLQSTAIRVTAGQEVVWPFDEAEAAVDALIATGHVVLGQRLGQPPPRVLLRVVLLAWQLHR